MLKRSVGRDTSQKRKGEPPGMSALDGTCCNEFPDIGLPEDPLVRIFWIFGDSRERALAPAPNVGNLMLKCCRKASLCLKEEKEGTISHNGDLSRN